MYFHSSILTSKPLSLLVNAGRVRGFATTVTRKSPYDQTIKNLNIGKDTRVIFQGMIQDAEASDL